MARTRRWRGRTSAGDEAEARRYVELGQEATAKIADDDDRALIEADLDASPVTGFGASAENGRKIAHERQRRLKAL